LGRGSLGQVPLHGGCTSAIGCAARWSRIAQLVELATVNRSVVGSSPTPGARGLFLPLRTHPHLLEIVGNLRFTLPTGSHRNAPRRAIAGYDPGYRPPATGYHGEARADRSRLQKCQVSAQGLSRAGRRRQHRLPPTAEFPPATHGRHRPRAAGRACAGSPDRTAILRLRNASAPICQRSSSSAG
jgi:hypothetical protein